jgi:hypothetical protein
MQVIIFLMEQAHPNESSMANILLLLGTEETSPSGKAEVEETPEAQEVAKPSSGAILPSLKQVMYPVPPPTAYRCYQCQNDHFPCYSCRPDQWITCNDILLYKYPNFAPPFTRGSPYELHAVDFIRYHQIKSLNMSRFHHVNAYIIPIQLTEQYLSSFDLSFQNLPALYEHQRKKKHHQAEALRVYTGGDIKTMSNKRKNIETDYPTPPTNPNSERIGSEHQSKQAKPTEVASPLSESMVDATPRPQPVKSKNDQYTPKWVRYSGAKKEGLCDLCHPEKWLQLKDSAFWYHKQFFHGISSSGGAPFMPPSETRAVWDGYRNGNGISINLMSEGKCGHCKEWIPMFKNKKRFSHYFQTFEAARAEFETMDSKSTIKARIFASDPFKCVVGRDAANTVMVPATIPMSQALLAEIADFDNGKMSGVWWRHAHKCHVYKE